MKYLVKQTQRRDVNPCTYYTISQKGTHPKTCWVDNTETVNHKKGHVPYNCVICCLHNNQTPLAC